MSKAVVALAVLTLCASVALAVAPVALGGGMIRRVPQDYPTVQAAINASADGDTVLVSAGTYAERTDFLRKDITVESVERLEPPRSWTAAEPARSWT